MAELATSGKWCCGCKQYMDPERFCKNKARPDGRSTLCRECSRIKRTEGRRNDPIKRENSRLTSQNYRKNNLDRYAGLARKWRADNPGKYKFLDNKKRAAKLNASPKWLTEEQWSEMDRIYVEAALIGKHVDHVVPLQGKHVCGLHVPWNLELMDPNENMAKCNKHESDVYWKEAV